MRKPLSLRRAEARTAARSAGAEVDGADAGRQVARINDLIRAARANWFGLLAYLAFVGVMLMGVQDADFFIPERQTELPLIGVEIPTFLFFWVAPALGAALYAYLHLNLLRLWEALGDHLRISGTTGPPLVNRSVPWLVTDHALAGTDQGPPRGRPLRGLANLVTWGLTYAGAPLVLAAFFYRSMPAHNEALTVLGCALPLWVSLFAGMTSARHRRACLTGRPARRWPTRAALWSAALALPVLGWFSTEGTLDHYVLGLGYPDIDESRLGRDWTANMPEPGKAPWSELPLPGLLVRADLSNVDFVDVPSDWRDFETARKAYRVVWCRDHGLPPDICGPVRPDVEHVAALDHRRQRWCEDHLPASVPKGETSFGARCSTRFASYDTEFDQDWRAERAARFQSLTPRVLTNRDFRNANLIDARLEGANLWGARLEGAILWRARLEGADLSGARLEGADLWEARLEGAVLGGAQLEGAVLDEARLEGAELLEARLEGTFLSGANLRGTELEGADLRRARLEGANLSEARMEGAYLWGARMEGADLSVARLEGAYLSGARLEGANLWRARFDETTDFRPATMRGAGLKSVDLSMLTVDPDILADAFGDVTVILPDGLKAGEPPLAHWSTSDLDWDLYGEGPTEFSIAWRAWQAEIGYVPPAR